MLQLRIIVILVLGSLVNFCFAGELPHYIRPCSIKDPEEFNRCAIKSGDIAIPFLLKSDKRFKIPSLDPLKLQKVHFSPGPQLNIDVKNIEIYGLRDTKTTFGSVDTKNGILIIQAFIPNVTIIGDYVTKGQLLIFPIEGNGKMRLESANVTYTYNLEIENMQLDSNKLMKLKNTVITFVEDGLKLHFENLFNGNKLLSDETNKVLNENWKAVEVDLGPVFSKSIDEVLQVIVRNTLEKFYFREAFLP